MQEIDALRSRVEATARKLSSVQAERRDQTHSLVAILRQLEERHAAQEQELAWYRERLGPLEQANELLVALLEHLLDLFDRSFGDDSIEPLHRAAAMASAMLARDLAIAGSEADSDTGPAFHVAAEDADDPETADASELDGDSGGVTDLHMEEDALVRLDQLVEPASGEGAEEPHASAAMYEDVSEVVLEEEARADAAAGSDDLPDIVKAATVSGRDASAATASATLASPSPQDEVEAIAAIAQALEEETSDADAPPPAPSDIRALLLRVEALARKAEAMRLAQQEGPGQAQSSSGAAVADDRKQPGAAA